MRYLLIAVVLTLTFAGAAAQAQTPTRQTSAPQEAKPAALKNDYSKGESWICRPGRKDPCAADMTTTVVAASGEMKRETWTANPNAPIDCFYVYPTVSLDPTPNSDMNIGPEEQRVVVQQLARFGSQCRLYAPLYRQVTLTALRAGMAGQAMGIDRMLAYNDILDAWRHYLANDNKGRGVVLIGHSQGSGVLTQLIRNEIDGKPIQQQIVSALLLGTNIPVPKGKDVGGVFQSMPLCRSADQIGCVIAYVTFRSNVPPPSNSRFGRVVNQEMEAACTNPAALGGGSGELHAYLASGRTGLSSAAEPRPWVKDGPAVDTPFVSVPGLLTGKCISDQKGSYLSVTVHGNPDDPRTDDIPGDVVTNGRVMEDWGLHLIDANIAMGNLVEIVGRQSRAYTSKKKK